MTERQSEEAGAVEGDVIRARRLFAAALHRRLEVLGVAPRNRVTWLQEALGEKRWPTVQAWLDGSAFPRAYRLRKIATALDMKMIELVGPMEDAIEPDWPTWREFLATKDGATVDDEERWALRLYRGRQRRPTRHASTRHV